MARKSLIRSDFLPYHVTARSNNREAFPLEPEQTWRVLTSECYAITSIYGAEIQALVMMPNHFHMIITIPYFDLGKVMNCFISSASRTTNRISGRTGHLFGGPYNWSLINSGHYYSNVLKYVYRNPVKANLVDRVEDFQYSTLHGILGKSHLPFPLYYPREGFFKVPEEQEMMLNWMNNPFSKEAQEAIRKGFRHRLFQIPTNRKTGKPNTLISGAT